jgi:OOP family OmpA-OmpF porin
MKKHLLFLAVCLVNLSVTAQKVLWAEKVVEVSSSYSTANDPASFSARNVLGKPSRMPGTGNSGAAWSPSTADNGGDEYIRVSFAEQIQVEQVAVLENYKPGTITKVILFDPKGGNHVVYENPTPGPTGLEGRMSNFFFPRTAYPVASVMVVLKTSTVPEFNHIDAIAISDSRDSIKAEIRIAEGLPTTGERENLGPNVNSASDELCPVISPDGKTLHFTRQGHPDNIPPADNQDIWVCQINPDGSFSPAKNLGEPLNNSDNSSVTSIAPDGNTMVLLNIYKRDSPMEKGVSITHKRGDAWDYPEALLIKDFYNDNQYGEYFLASSGKELIMTLQRKDSYGGKDLYVSFRTDSGTWTAPKHMGPQINSGGGETSPCLAADGITLYFSSDGFPGFGSKDMFLSRRLDSTWTNWSEPENMGPALNTPGWDAYYSIPASGEYAYFVSYSNSIGKADIFRAKLPSILRPKPVVLVRGKVLNSKTKLPIGGNITYERLSDGLELGIAYANPTTGEYSIVLPAGDAYAFLATSKGYFPVSENVNLKATTAYAEISRDLLLTPIEQGATIRLNNLFFDTGKYQLRPESVSELKRLIKVLDENPAMVIQISGHTDDVGTDATNLVLSQNRSKAVKDYLISKGVSAARLSSVGNGETKPQVPNTSDANRQINRRVEFTIMQN